MTVVLTGDEMRDEQERRGTAKERVLAALAAAGPNGVTNTALNDICFRYGARLHELRAEGHRIERHTVGRGVFRFVLVQDVAAPGWLF